MNTKQEQNLEDKNNKSKLIKEGGSDLDTDNTKPDSKKDESGKENTEGSIPIAGSLSKVLSDIANVNEQNEDMEDEIKLVQIAGEKITEEGSYDLHKERELVFGRRDSLPRTPPGLKQTKLTSFKADGEIYDNPFSAPVRKEPVFTYQTIQTDEVRATSSSDEDESKVLSPEEKLAKKRKRELKTQNTNDSKISVKIDIVVDKLRKNIEKLAGVVKTNINTKMDIKEVSRNLTFLIENLESEMKKNTYKVKEGKKPKRRNVGTETEDENLKDTKKETKEVGTQTKCDEEDELSILTESFGKDKAFKNIEKILDREWPEDFFKKTREEIGNAGKEGNKMDLVIVVDPKDTGEKGLSKIVLDRYPEMKEIWERNQEEKEVRFIERSTKLHTSTGRRIQESKYMYILNVEIYSEGVTNMEDVYEKYLQLRDSLIENNRREVAFASPDGLDRTYSRKLLEYIFKDTDIKINYLIPMKEGSKSLRERRQNETTITVKKEEKSYADLLKDMKQRVDLNKMKVEIKKIKKDKRGGIVLTVGGGKEKAEALKKEMHDKIENLDITTRKNGITLFITGMEETTTEEEVKKALKTTLELEDGEIENIAIKPGRYGDSMATVRVPYGKGRKLIKGGKIKVGWVNCLVKENLMIIRCFNCLEHGHRADKCTAKITRSDHCIKCGEKGHKAKECQNGPFCIKCQIAGHRADQIKCPFFKQLIENRRRERLKSVNSVRRGRRARAAHDLAFAKADKINADIIIVSEPNKKTVDKTEWIKDKRRDVAIFCRNKNIGIKSHKEGRGFVKIIAENFVLIGCYVSPNVPLEDYKNNIDEIMEEARENRQNAIVAGDLNGKSHLWGSPINDSKGEHISDWLSELDMMVANCGGTPTFERGDSKSFIDVTLCGQRIGGKIKNWHVDEEESLSLHKYIVYELEINREKKSPKMKENKRIYIRKEELRPQIQRVLHQLDINDPKSYVKQMKLVQEQCSNADGINREYPYWWNLQIEEKRKECITFRRRIKRLRATILRNEQTLHKIREHEETYKKNKKELRRLINKSKRDLWAKLCHDLEGDIWGEGYRIVVKQLKQQSLPYVLTNEKKRRIVSELFPQTEDTWVKGTLIQNVKLFDMQELIEAGDKLKNNKAPGPDGIRVETIKELIGVAPDKVLDMLNALITKQHFPNIWKEARIILIPKGKKNSKGEETYRPICLLDTFGKLYEMLIRTRLENELEDKNGLSENQFGFRKGFSTIQAVERVVKAARRTRKGAFFALITLDVQNAFNTASWSLIIRQMRDIGISPYLIRTVESYLDQRKIKINNRESELATAGVPQGSVLGPTLWNILYDGVLRILLPEEAQMVAYADDLALMVQAMKKEELMHIANLSLLRISRWMEENRLKLAQEKTEALLMKGARKKDGIGFEVEGNRINPQKSIKYLGVWLDDKMLFNQHVKQTVEKAQKSVSAIKKITPNIGGPGSLKRRMLYGVVESIALYGAPIWCNVLEKRKYANMMFSLQRQMLIRVASTYRTISKEAANIISGVIPIDLLAVERKLLYESGKGHLSATRNRIREDIMDRWQRRWEHTTDVAQWTKRLIPDIKEWATCKFRKTDFYLSQFLSGHGCYNTYLKKMKKREDGACVYCGEEDTPEHTIFICRKWYTERDNIQREVGEITPENIIATMVANEEAYEKIYQFIKYIMKEKRKNDS